VVASPLGGVRLAKGAVPIRPHVYNVGDVRLGKDIGFHGESLAKDTQSQAAPPQPGSLPLPRASVAAH
jgi:hypothetical protein